MAPKALRDKPQALHKYSKVTSKLEYLMMQYMYLHFWGVYQCQIIKICSYAQRKGLTQTLC